MTTPLEIQIGALVNGLASELLAALEDGNGGLKPCLVTVLPGGLVPFDYCEDGGMAWARLAGISPVEQTDPFAQCFTEYEVVVELGVLRCAPTLHEDNTLPTMEEHVAAAMQQNADMGMMQNILTCWTAPPSFSRMAIGTFTPVGPDGMCVGGFWTARWRLA